MMQLNAKHTSAAVPLKLVTTALHYYWNNKNKHKREETSLSRTWNVNQSKGNQHTKTAADSSH